MFRVHPKTVVGWASQGRLRHVRTPGGHLRFRESDVRTMLRPGAEDSPVRVENVNGQGRLIV
jgi:excisionase family DNA binding protein